MDEKKTVLIVEDEKSIVDILQYNLKKEYNILTANDGEAGLDMALKENPDILLLDLMLPGLPGEELLPHLAGIPVIVVSARAATEDKVNLLLGGAADYITKPFQLPELLARITVQLRRVENPLPNSVLEAGSLRLDTHSHTLTLGGIPVRLTPTEYAILKLLLQRPGQVITRSLLLEHISQDTPDCSEGSLKQHISNLRGKLRAADGWDYIQAVWGIGFRLALPGQS